MRAYAYKTNRIQLARRRYRCKLRGEDVIAAYEAGKQYYAALHGGAITQSDLLAIAQDLNVMVDRMETIEGSATFMEVAKSWRSLDVSYAI